MSAQSPQSKARYVPDSKVTANPPSDARIAFIPADGDEGDEDYTTVADLGTGGGGQTLVIANDEDITVAASPGTTIVLYTALTAPRTVNLPPASSASMTVIVKDMNGLVTDDNTVTLVAAGGDTIIGNTALFPPLGNGTALRAMASIANDGTTHWADIGETDEVEYLAYFTVTALQTQLAPRPFIAPGSITTAQLGQALIDLGLMSPS